jgi:hypothetical protein
VVDVLVDAAMDTAASLPLGDGLAKLVNEQRRRNGLGTKTRLLELGLQLRHVDAASVRHVDG